MGLFYKVNLMALHFVVARQLVDETNVFNTQKPKLIPYKPDRVSACSFKSSPTLQMECLTNLWGLNLNSKSCRPAPSQGYLLTTDLHFHLSDVYFRRPSFP